MSGWLFLMLVGSAVPRTEAPRSCEVSAFWSQVDESVLDTPTPEGHVRRSVATNCVFAGVPGAKVDVYRRGERVVTGAEVVGMRRMEGRVELAVTVAEAAELRGPLVVFRASPAPNWMDLLQEVERAQRRAARE